MNRVFLFVRVLMVVGILFGGLSMTSAIGQTMTGDCDSQPDDCIGDDEVVVACDCWSADCGFQDYPGDCYFCCNYITDICS